MTDYIIISLVSTFFGCMFGLSLNNIIKDIKAAYKKKEDRVDTVEEDLNDPFTKRKRELQAKMNSDIYRANAEIFTKIYTEKIRKPANELQTQLNLVRNRYYNKYRYAASVEEITVFKCKCDFVKGKYFWYAADDRDPILECFIGDEFTTDLLTEEQITAIILKHNKHALAVMEKDREWLEKFAVYKLGDTTYNILDEED